MQGSGGASRTTRRRPGIPHSPAGALQPLRGRARRSAARVGHGPCAAGEVLRHVVKHRIEACPFVQILDAPVPQGGNQLVKTFRHLDLHIPEQVIEVPKISSSRRRCRRRRVPVVQMAEQLVEVPEFVSFAFLFQQQIVDAPGRPQGLLPGQDYSLVWEQIVWSGSSGRSSRCTPRTEFSSVLWSRTR